MTSITHRAFFGDGDHGFSLTDPMIAELERLTDIGIGGFYIATVRGQFRAEHLVEVLRLGLIGGGTAPEHARQLVDTYARNRPLSEVYPLALDVLDARWNGVPEVEPEAAV